MPLLRKKTEANTVVSWIYDCQCTSVCVSQGNVVFSLWGVDGAVIIWLRVSVFVSGVGVFIYVCVCLASCSVKCQSHKVFVCEPAEMQLSTECWCDKLPWACVWCVSDVGVCFIKHAGIIASGWKYKYAVYWLTLE